MQIGLVFGLCLRQLAGSFAHQSHELLCFRTRRILGLAQQPAQQIDGFGVLMFLEGGACIAQDLRALLIGEGRVRWNSGGG